MDNESTIDLQHEDPELIACPGCLHEHIEGPHFCVNCGAPLSALSTIGPFERIFAQGHMFRRATSKPISPIVLIGIWLLLFPQLLLIICTTPLIDSTNLWCLFVIMPIALIYAALLYKTTRNYIDRRNEEKI